MFVQVCSGSNSCIPFRVDIKRDGAVQVQEGKAGKWVSFSGIVFQADH
jgi:hypothetical protein